MSHKPTMIDDTDTIDVGICPAHSGLCVTAKANAANIEKLWTAHTTLNETVTKIMVKIASIVGGATVLQIVIMVALQIYFKK